jgi:hypothetical protein
MSDEESESRAGLPARSQFSLSVMKSFRMRHLSENATGASAREDLVRVPDVVANPKKRQPNRTTPVRGPA